MKTKSSVLIIFVLIMLGLTACKEEQFKPIPEKERTYFHILNAYTGFSGIDVKLLSFDENRWIADDLGFKDSWPKTGYASLLTAPDPDSVDGRDGVTFQVYEHTTKTALVTDLSLVLPPNTYTSFCLIDSFGKPLLVKTVDNIRKVEDPKKALIRFMNIEYKTLSVTMKTTDDSVNIEKLNYLNYSTFAEFPAGKKTFLFINDFTGNVIDSISNLEIKPGKAYSFYLTEGYNGPTADYEILD
ncbi:MAG: hypothetical protein KDE26_03955 [Bacteroidetes bacterium]|nr:hypothetical protein [Bacteroidota bacterium]MCB0842403.1 hypothetical protein [Bacteroidota bacterium]